MEEIFQWLRDNGVKKILTAIVLDNIEPSHSDAAIENSLKDFKVEVWDWKKLDLNSDVIANSTNGAVREISLYSSGNNAVLMGVSIQISLSPNVSQAESHQIQPETSPNLLMLLSPL